MNENKQTFKNNYATPIRDIKNKIAILVGKLALLILGPKSSSAPGLAALKVSPNLLENLLNSIKEEPIYVTGTNGKSTTAGFLASILSENKLSLVHNTSGANMLTGLTTALLKKVSQLSGDVSANQALLEVDEAFLQKISKQVPAKLILVTNFFRDQLDRFGEMENTIRLVQEGLNLTEEGTLVTNADDPNTCHLKASKILYFGISAKLWQENKPEIFAEELANCPVCDEDLQYSSQWLGQLGEFSCKNCGYQKPKPQVLVTQLQMNTEGSQASIQLSDETMLEVTIPLPGLFNVYNAVAAITCAYDLQIPLEQIQAGIQKYKPLFGRSEEVVYKNKKAKIFLIKNPIGASEVLRLIHTDKKAKVLIAINDNYADGRDVCWLWDAYFEYLKDNTHPIYVTGSRGTDIAIRLKYAGVKKIHYYANLQRALNEFVETSQDENLYILPTYTALLELVKILR
jgi:UDP-N-acetylmuramyl tripeptide synthase